MYSSAYVWAKILNYIEECLGTVTVSAWFDDAEVVELTEELKRLQRIPQDDDVLENITYLIELIARMGD